MAHFQWGLMLIRLRRHANNDITGEKARRVVICERKRRCGTCVLG